MEVPGKSKYRTVLRMKRQAVRKAEIDALKGTETAFYFPHIDRHITYGGKHGRELPKAAGAGYVTYGGNLADHIKLHGLTA